MFLYEWSYQSQIGYYEFLQLGKNRNIFPDNIQMVTKMKSQTSQTCGRRLHWDDSFWIWSIIYYENKFHKNGLSYMISVTSQILFAFQDLNFDLQWDCKSFHQIL